MYSDTLPLFQPLLPAYVRSLPDRESGLLQLPWNQALPLPETDDESPFFHDKIKDNFRYLLHPVHLPRQAVHLPSD